MIKVENASEFQPEARLIAAILEQAVYEAQKYRKSELGRKAQKFLTLKHPVFKKYCFLLNLEPEWICQGIKRKLQQRESKNVT